MESVMTAITSPISVVTQVSVAATVAPDIAGASGATGVEAPGPMVGTEISAVGEGAGVPSAERAAPAGDANAGATPPTSSQAASITSATPSMTPSAARSVIPGS